MHAAAVIVLTAGLWALGRLPEHISSLIFFALAMVFAIAPAPVVFSGFASATMWLVLGGLILAEAVTATGLGRRFASILFDRRALTYTGLVTAVALVATALTFVMPATVGRILLLVPIVAALAERVGFTHGSSGFSGLVLSAIMVTYQSGTCVLPANAPNLVLAGSAEAVYGVQFMYAQYLWVMLPVLGLLKMPVTIALICWLFPAEVKPRAASPALVPMSAAERRLAAIVIVALVLWATDFLHGVRAGWVALAAGVACFMPRIGVLPFGAFNDVKMGAFFYVGASIGLGAVAQDSGLGELLGRWLQATLDLQPSADLRNFVTLSVLDTLMGLIVTNPAQPAVMTPLASQFAEAAGWPLAAALMTSAVGFNMLLLPYQVPPVMVGLHAAGVPVRVAVRLTLPLAALGIFVFLPLDYLWWRLIGYFG